VSVKIEYRCDRCGAVQESSEQFWTVEVIATGHGEQRRSYGNNGRIEVCRPCLEGFGIHVRPKPDAASTPPPPSLEEMIREICQLEAR